MERTTTEAFTYDKVHSLTLPTWELGPVVVRGDETNIEIFKVEQKHVQDAIRSYVRSMGYATGDLEVISAFLSELADDCATARTRVEDDLARKAAAAE